MKNIFFINIILVLTSSCIRDDNTMTEFIIRNESSKNIKIKVSRFETYGFQGDTVFSLHTNSECGNYFYDDGKNNPITDYPLGAAADSLEVIVNDTVFAFFRRDSINHKNPLNIKNYTGGKIKDGYYKYKYVITDEYFKQKKQ